jgi:hypothetical protein
MPFFCLSSSLLERFVDSVDVIHFHPVDLDEPTILCSFLSDDLQMVLRNQLLR